MIEGFVHHSQDKGLYNCTLVVKEIIFIAILYRSTKIKQKGKKRNGALSSQISLPNKILCTIVIENVSDVKTKQRFHNCSVFALLSNYSSIGIVATTAAEGFVTGVSCSFS